MTYSTVEAYVKDEKVVFSKGFVVPKKNMKVLVTFIETEKYNDEIDFGLYELNKSEVTNELMEKSEKVLKKDKKLFTNI